MNAPLKLITEWIKKHKVATSVIALILLVILVKARNRSKNEEQASLSEPLKKGTIVESVYGIGTVTAARTFPLKTGVSSTVQRLFVREGDRVKRGQKLIDLDGTYAISAPFDGTITYLPVKIGETVFAQATVLIVTDLHDRYITVSLEQRGAIRVRHGQKARISFDSLRDQVFEGVVQSIYSNDSNFLVRIGVTTLPEQILPGMTADVAIGVNEHKDTLLVPVAALDSGKVFVKNGNTAGVDVKVGLTDGATAEILSGDIHEGEILMIRKKVGQ